jgi:hypothetical protein
MKFIVTTKVPRREERQLMANTEFEVIATSWLKALQVADAWAREAEALQTAVVYHVRQAAG